MSTIALNELIAMRDALKMAHELLMAAPNCNSGNYVLIIKAASIAKVAVEMASKEVRVEVTP